MKIRHLLNHALILLGLLMTYSVQGQDTAPEIDDGVEIGIISTDFVLPGKFTLLRELAAPHEITVKNHYISSGENTVSDWFSQSSLIILDTPRGNDRAQVMDAVQDMLTETQTPWLAVGGGRPTSGNLTEPVFRTLMAYYNAGGEANFRHMMQYIQAWLSGNSLADIPTPVTLPDAGIYHPAADRFFSNWADYLAWGKQRWQPDAPVMAVAMSSSSISDAQTALYDELIAELEAAGGTPLVFWFDRNDIASMNELLTPAAPSMLVNTTHLVGEAVKEALWEHDIPLVMGLNYRDGSIAQWRESVSGISPSSAATLMVIPEVWGMSDPLVISALEDGVPTAIPEQLDLLTGRFMAMANLQRLPVESQQLALLFWNSPAGEKNLSASNLNVPRSIESISKGLQAAGYDVTAGVEADLIETAQRLLSAYYRPETLDELLADGLAETLPLTDYQSWLQSLPDAINQQMLTAWGQAENHPNVRDINGEAQFIIPIARLGKLAFLPQPPRADRLGESTHDLVQPPGHLYLATYLYLREQYQADAFIHLGTHGTQEWTPGKDRGLWAYDYPNLAIGNVPTFYPYIQDNIGEAMQAKRRGRATVISHQTAPFAPSGFYDELLDIHDLMHQYLQLEPGAVRDNTLTSMFALVSEHNIQKDLGWSEAQMHEQTDAFVAELHDHLHVLAQASTPIGLHTFGESAGEEYLISTVMQQLGSDYYQALQLDTTEVFAESFDALFESPAYTHLHPYLSGEKAAEDAETPALQSLMAQAVSNAERLRDTQEIEGLLDGLQGKMVAPGGGGDPVRNPNTTSGTNLYALDPERIPTAEAYQAAEATYQQLIADYRENHDGETPDKLAFSLWSSETIRTLGVNEAQIMHALGVKPVWDNGGRVTHLEVIPQHELNRPRVDTVVQITSVYRDQFDGLMKKISMAIEELASADGEDNVIASNSQQLMASLQQQGLSVNQAKRYANARLFSNPPGSYGSGVTDAAMNSTEWEDDSILADTFLNSQSHIYSHHDWGTPVHELGLLESQLNGVDAVLLSRSSNLHGLLSTDHPFEYMGGLSSAINAVSEKRPEMYISDARSTEINITSASSFLASDLRTRYQNPQWIEGMKAEGYAGTVEMLKVVNNMFGWQVTDPNMIRDDQWQAMHDTYVMDQRDLDLNEFFAEYNATAQAQLIERMVEAIRKGYWDASENTRRELVERWNTLVNELDATPGAEQTVAFIEEQAAGFGINMAAPAPESATQSEAQSEPQNAETSDAQPVRGQMLEPVTPQTQTPMPNWALWLTLLMLSGTAYLGAHQRMTLLKQAQLA